MNNIDIILINPENPSNAGSVSRAMANFGFKRLIMVDPGFDPNDSDFFRLAKHSIDKVEVKVLNTIKELNEYSYLVGTTAITGDEYSLSRQVIPFDKTCENIHTINQNKDKKIGILFGRESDGLHNDELAMCNIITSIPVSEDYPTMNLSHAVTVLLYEISKINNNRNKNIDLAENDEKLIFLERINNIIDNCYDNKDKAKVHKNIWKNVIKRSLVSKRELNAMLGIFKKSR